MNIWPQGGHIFQKTAGWPPFPALCHMPHTVLLHAYRPCRRFIIPHSQNPPFAFGPAPLRVWHLLRQAHPSLSLAFAKWTNYTTFSGHTPSATWAGARRPFRPSHAAPAMRGIPPHLPGPASLFACVHQAGGARSIRPLFHMQPAPAGQTKVRERASRHQPARRAAPANRPRLYRAIQTRRPAHVIIKVGRHGRPERGKGR